jgi:hypothetical protein
MSKPRRFEFSDRQARNAFLQANGLCIAGSIRQQPNIQDAAGNFVGSAFEEADGRYLVEIIGLFCE